MILLLWGVQSTIAYNTTHLLMSALLCQQELREKTRNGRCHRDSATHPNRRKPNPKTLNHWDDSARQTHANPHFPRKSSAHLERSSALRYIFSIDIFTAGRRSGWERQDSSGWTAVEKASRHRKSQTVKTSRVQIPANGAHRPPFVSTQSLGDLSPTTARKNAFSRP